MNRVAPLIYQTFIFDLFVSVLYNFPFVSKLKEQKYSIASPNTFLSPNVLVEKVCNAKLKAHLSNPLLFFLTKAKQFICNLYLSMVLI